MTELKKLIDEQFVFANNIVFKYKDWFVDVQDAKAYIRRMDWTLVEVYENIWACEVK